MTRIQRMLRWYDPRSDELVGEEPLRDPNLANLHRLFDFHDMDPLMYACYEVTEAQRDAVQRLVTHHLQLGRYAYFVEADAVPVSEPAAPGRR